MMGLFDSPVLQIQQLSSQLEYEISDENGRPLGSAAQVAGRKPNKGLRAMVSGSGLEGARVIVQVRDPDGTPAFFVDRQDGAPVAIVAPDGALIGRFGDDDAASWQQSAANTAGRAPGLSFMLSGPVRPAMIQRLTDPAGSPLCELHWEFRQGTVDGNRSWLPTGCAYNGPNGQQIARLDYGQAKRKDSYVLRLLGRLPEPLRTLVIASPLAFDLSRS